MDLVRTEDIITEKELKELFSFDEFDGLLREEEWTHDGCWKYEFDTMIWRFWKFENE